jgi:hypothetical protein
MQHAAVVREGDAGLAAPAEGLGMLDDDAFVVRVAQPGQVRLLRVM